MAYFTDEFISFHRDLEENNNRDWFHENKKRYEKNVKAPFTKFINDLIIALSEEEGPIHMEAKNAVFRIHRDIRFSKDKTPYKIHTSAIISKNGKKDKSSPGMYFQVNHKDARIYSGMYELDKDQLKRVRQYIANHSNELDKLIHSKEFKNTFGEILGEKNKRLPPEFQEAAELQPLIFNKSFYFFHKMEPQVMLRDDLIDHILSIHRKSQPLRAYLTEAVQN